MNPSNPSKDFINKNLSSNEVGDGNTLLKKHKKHKKPKELTLKEKRKIDELDAFRDHQKHVKISLSHFRFIIRIKSS